MNQWSRASEVDYVMHTQYKRNSVACESRNICEKLNTSKHQLIVVSQSRPCRRAPPHWRLFHASGAKLPPTTPGRWPRTPTVCQPADATRRQLLCTDQPAWQAPSSTVRHTAQYTRHNTGQSRNDFTELKGRRTAWRGAGIGDRRREKMVYKLAASI